MRKVILSALVLCVMLLLVGTASAWYDTDWYYRKEFTINNTGSELTNYQVMFTVNRSAGSDSGSTVYLNSKCEADYDDIRFVGADDTTAWDCWIESSSATVATIWVEVPSLPTGDTTAYLYYGNAGAGAVSNGDNTFSFFDDFSSGSLDTDKWDVVTGGITQSGGVVTCTASSSALYAIKSKNAQGTNISVRARVFPSHYNSGSYLEGFLARYIDSTHHMTAYYSHVAGSNLKYYQNNGGVVGTGDVAGGSSNWFIQEAKLGASSTIWQINNANTVTVSTGYYATSSPIGISAYGAGSVTKCDWIFVRKYTATEPTVSAWGSEELAQVVRITSDFSALPLSGHIPLTVYFTDESTGNNCTVDSWQWSFGDGTPNSTQQNPAHTYTTTGLYTVILTAFNTTFSREGTEAKTAYINATYDPNAPSADFTVTETCGDVGDTFYFIDFSTGGGLYAWNWSFGDGSYSELRNPTHQYSSNGEYDISLTVSGACGTDTITKEDYITIPCSVITPTPTTPTPTPTTTTTYVSHGNIAAYDIGIDYIIWKISDMNTTHLYADGKLVNLSGMYYGQHGLSPDTPHTVCLNNGECLTVSTHIDGISVFWYWSVFILLIILVIISYRIPITYAPTVLYGIYLVLVLLPNRSAGFEEYLLTGILLIFGIIAASRGMTK